jgi:uncharacterized membrane protein YhaH (DUF805 family)
MGWLAFLFSWRGRFSRVQFPLMYVAAGLIGVAVLFGAVYASHLLPSNLREWNVVLIYSIYSLPTAYLQVGAIIKRLHDVGLSGWWLAAAVGLVAGSAYAIEQLQLKGTTYEPIVMIPVIAISIIGFLVLLLTPGTTGTNQYGPDPFGRGQQTFRSMRAEGN